MHRGQDDRGFFPPVERAQIENLACSDPAESGLEQIRWSVRALADAAVEQEIVDRIHYTSVALLLRQATLKPHRSRYWKSTVWNAQAVECATTRERCDVRPSHASSSTTRETEEAPP